MLLNPLKTKFSYFYDILFNLRDLYCFIFTKQVKIYSIINKFWIKIWVIFVNFLKCAPPVRKISNWGNRDGHWGRGECPRNPNFMGESPHRHRIGRGGRRGDEAHWCWCKPEKILRRLWRHKDNQIYLIFHFLLQFYYQIFKKWTILPTFTAPSSP